MHFQSGNMQVVQWEENADLNSHTMAGLYPQSTFSESDYLKH